MFLSLVWCIDVRWSYLFIKHGARTYVDAAGATFVLQVLFAFMVGLHNLYWYYGSQTYVENNECNQGKLLHTAEAFQGWATGQFHARLSQLALMSNLVVNKMTSILTESSTVRICACDFWHLARWMSFRLLASSGRCFRLPHTLFSLF